MKMLFVLLGSLSFLSSFSQVFTAVVKNAQHFTHALTCETSYAIEHNLMEYGDSYETNTTYTFDLTNKKLKIEFKGDPTYIQDIIEVSKTSNIMNVIVRFTLDNSKVDYLISEVPGEQNYMLMCRHAEDGKLKG